MYSSTSCFIDSRVKYTIFYSHSCFKLPKNHSTTTLSKQAPTLLIEAIILCFVSKFWNCLLVYCEPLSLWNKTPPLGWRNVMAICNARTTKLTVIRFDRLQPIIDVCTYSVMTNHLHLVLRVDAELHVEVLMLTRPTINLTNRERPYMS